MEDALEMSSDNLALLKEEAKMVDIPVLMRYIQVLSELSNDIKYASGKRVLIEIALIKLCKPEMEMDISALNNRMTNIEKKLEKGLPVQVQASAVQAQSPNAANVKKEPLPEAIPEEVKQLVSNWSSLLGKLPVNIKMYLKQATTYTVNEQGELVIIYDQPQGSERMAGDFLNRPEVIAEVESAAEEMIKKHVKIKVEINSSGVSSQDSKTDIRDFFASKGIQIESED